MVRTQISVDEQLYRRAKILARRKGISLAELCRRSLEETLVKSFRPSYAIDTARSRGKLTVDVVLLTAAAD